MIERAEIIREKGTDRARFFRGQVDKYSWMDLGSSFLPGELIAAFLLAQLENENSIREARTEIWATYDRAFRPLIDNGRIDGPHIPGHCTTNGHMYYLLLRDLTERAAFIEHMKADQIHALFHYVPLHSAPAGRKFGRGAAAMPVTDNISERLVRLPAYLNLGGEIDRVIGRAMAFLR